MNFIKNNARPIVVILLVALTVFAVGGNKKDNNTDTTSEQKKSSSKDTNVAKNDVPSSPNNNDPNSTKEVAKAGDEFSVTALSGDNQTKLVRRILAEYVATSSATLYAEQKLYVETNLVDSLPRNDLIFVGDTVKVQESELMHLVEQSKKLSKAQLSAWSRYL